MKKYKNPRRIILSRIVYLLDVLYHRSTNPYDDELLCLINFFHDVLNSEHITYNQIISLRDKFDILVFAYDFPSDYNVAIGNMFVILLTL